MRSEAIQASQCVRAIDQQQTSAATHGLDGSWLDSRTTAGLNDPEARHQANDDGRAAPERGAERQSFEARTVQTTARYTPSATTPPPAAAG